jgi:nucleoside-diphosphate-sugar epimerase
MLTANLLLAALDSAATVARVVIYGSAAAYGRDEPGELPVAEDAPRRGHSIHAISKADEEDVALACRLSGVPVTAAWVSTRSAPA